MSQLFTIQDDKIVINKLALRYLEGSVIHAGTLDIVGNTSIRSNLNVVGTLTADTINVKNLVSENGGPTNLGQWVFEKESDLVGKGFSWAWGGGGIQLIYRQDDRLWLTGNLDLGLEKSYKIDNVPVLSYNELGSQVTKSRLRELGVLNSLEVSGNSILSEFAFFNATSGRLGLNTDQPSSALTILDNDIEIVMGSPSIGTAVIGTRTNHNLAFISDNTPRILLKGNGEIVFGAERTKNANVTVYGTLKVDTLIADTRIERTTPLEFKATRSSPIYGQGLVWSGDGDDKMFILRNTPDRLWSTESIDLQIDHSYFIGGIPVLTQSSLGASVLDSNLTSVGLLRSLSVQGDSNFIGSVSVNKTLNASCIVISDNENFINIKDSSLNSSSNFAIKVFEDEVFYADANEISIGNNLNTRRPVKLFGPLSVGVSNPDPTIGLSVNGNISFNNKKFITGGSAPTVGSFMRGDICWNNTPIEGNYVGWVCVIEGIPGTWAPFGIVGAPI